MEKTKSNSAPERHITLSLIIGWVVGVIAAISGIGYIFTNPPAGLLFILIALITLPPVSMFVKTKYNFSISGWLKIIGVFGLLMVIGSVMGDSDGSGNVADRNNEETSQSATREYQEVYTFSGTGQKQSESFNIQGDRFKISYSCKGDSAATYCGAFVYKVDSKLPQGVMNATESVTDETIIYTAKAGKGEYYIDANVMGNFTMTVYDYR